MLYFYTVEIREINTNSGKWVEYNKTYIADDESHALEQARRDCDEGSIVGIIRSEECPYQSE